MSRPLYSHSFTLRLGDTDAAGVIYFARLLEHAHEAYEAFLAAAGRPLQDWTGRGIQIPVVHAEADFLSPMTLGQAIRVELRPGALGRSSFRLDYRFRDTAGEPLARASTVHVAMRAAAAVELPPDLRELLDTG
jgi:1,4-dihydroxy-2-naphthoyl-CoA hydrolase